MNSFCTQGLRIYKGMMFVQIMEGHGGLWCDSGVSWNIWSVKSQKGLINEVASAGLQEELSAMISYHVGLAGSWGCRK